MIIREYQPSDCEEIAKLFYNTVHTVNAKDYTKKQLDAWASGSVDLKKWNESLSEHFTLVAVHNGVITGFGDIDSTGYLDRLYVHKDYQRQGIATAVCDKLERAFDVTQITAHVSITAKPFFTHRGYEIVKEQQVVREGITLKNYIMQKLI